ncbi:MAG: ATP-grasp domain-containing protein, partial [Hyphomonadaceae bacterium]
MNIHEYQAKAVLKSFGVPVSDGVPILSLDDVQKAVDTLPGPLWVVKSQIHAGGRGKGTFIESEAGEKGGVRLAFSKEDVFEYAKQMLGNTLVTKQTGDAGKQVNRLYIEDGADIETELYLSILVDRETGKVAFVASTEGGMDIEQVAHDTAEKIHTIQVEPLDGMTDADAGNVCDALELTGDARSDGMTLFPTLYKAFWETDMSMLEINPLIVMKDGHLRVLDAKVSFDENALFRQPDMEALEDETERDPKEVEAAKHD